MSRTKAEKGRKPVCFRCGSQDWGAANCPDTGREDQSFCPDCGMCSCLRRYEEDYKPETVLYA